jgi:TonB family protein
MALRFFTSASIALTFAAITAFSQAPSTITGTVSDASGTAVGRATVVLSTAEGRTEAITTGSAAGAYMFTGLQAGSYTLQVFAVGFGPSRMTTVQLEGGNDLKQNLTMDIGFARDSAAAPPPITEPPSAAAMLSPEVNLSRSTPADPTRLRLSENLSSRNLIVHPEPVYPELARQARIQGIVILEVVIGTDGVPKNVSLVSGHPLLQKAAVDAVKEWRYRPQLVAGAPAEVVTTVMVPFRWIP